MIVTTAAEMRALDQQTIENFGLPGRLLMENAGRGATRCFLERIRPQAPGRIGVLAGRGNNGGDGFVIARYLAHQGIDVRVYLLARADGVQGDAAANLNLLTACGVAVTEISDEKTFTRLEAEMRHISGWVDALLGTGLNTEVQGLYRRAIQFLNDRRCPVLAVDIPSGLNADTGQPCGLCVQATATATFGFAKVGQLIHPGTGFCGVLEVIDIGIPPAVVTDVNPRQELIEPLMVRAALGDRPAESHKGSFGHLLVIAGSPGKTGAAVMTAGSALRIGTGLVTLGTAAAIQHILAAQVAEAMTQSLPDDGEGILGGTAAFDAIVAAAQSKSALALGPGIGTAPPTRELVVRLAGEIDLPLVADADGLNCLAGQDAHFKTRRAPLVLTPHPGEAARLINLSVAQVQQDRPATARSIAARYNAWTVLKGARTLIADPGGRIWINPTGNAGMAAGGMGDVLTGLIAGLIAQGVPPPAACQAGVYLHGLAADLLAAAAPYGYLATEVAAAVPKAVRHILTQTPTPPLSRRFT